MRRQKSPKGRASRPRSGGRSLFDMLVAIGEAKYRRPEGEVFREAGELHRFLGHRLLPLLPTEVLEI